MKKKVVHVCTSKMSYKILEYKLKRIKDMGYDMSILSSNDCEVDETVIKESGINQFYVEMSREISLISDIKSIIEMKKIFEREKFDIVHTHTAKAGMIGRCAAYLAKTPIIIHTSHGLPFYKGMNKLKYNIFKFIEYIGMKISDYVGSQNKEDMSVLLKLTNNSSKVFYEGNGVDLEYLDYQKSKISEIEIKNLKNELGIDEDTITILIGARFEPVKNHKLFIDAIDSIVKKSDKKIKCILAGDGPLFEVTKSYIEEKGLSDYFNLVGKRKDIYKFILLSDIVALTSQKEGIPRIIMESMALEKPIIATDVLGTKELVENNVTGLLSEYGNVKQLSDNILSVIENRNIRIQFGRNGRRRIESSFTECIVAERVNEIYQIGK